MYDTSNVLYTPSRRREEAGGAIAWWGRAADEEDPAPGFAHENEAKSDSTVSNQLENSMTPPDLPITRLARRSAALARNRSESSRKGHDRGHENLVQHESNEGEDIMGSAKVLQYGGRGEEVSGQIEEVRQEDQQVMPSTPISPEVIPGQQQSPISLNVLSPQAPEVIELHPLQITIGDWSRVKSDDESLWAYFDSNMEIFHVVTVYGQVSARLLPPGGIATEGRTAQYQYLLSIPISTIEKATFCLSSSSNFNPSSKVPDTLVIRLTKPPNFYGSSLQGARVWTPISDFTVNQVASTFLLYAFSLGVPKSELQSISREEMLLNLAKWECLRNVVKIMKRPGETPLESISPLVEQSSSYVPPPESHFSFDEYSTPSNQTVYEDFGAGYSTPQYQSNSEEEYYHYEPQQRQPARDESHYQAYSSNPYPYSYPYSPNNYNHRQPYVYGAQSGNHHWAAGRGERALSV